MASAAVYSGHQLAPENREVVETIVKEHEPEHIFGLVNQDFSDGENLPSGLATIFSQKTRVNPDAIPQEAFQFTVACALNDKRDGTAWKDADFAGKLEALNEAVPQFTPENPPTLNGSHEVDVADDHPWNAELGCTDTFAGIMKLAHGGKAREANNKFYVVVQAGIPLVAQELRKTIASSNMTYKELLDHPDYKQARDLAKRNATRLAMQVAYAMKVEIGSAPDWAAKTSETWEAPPYKALPTFAQSMSTIAPYMGDKVAVYHKVRPIRDAKLNCMVYAGPYEGIAMFSMKGNSNQIGLPATSGRNATVNPNTRVNWKSRAEGLIWEGMGADCKHPDLHPDAFRPIDDKFLESMKTMGWEQSGIDNRHYLIPVCVKIFNPEIKRK